MRIRAERLRQSIKGHSRLYTIQMFLVLLFGLIVFMASWESDDAYHSFIMAKHLAEGDGLVYNVGYRVTASTCPLFTLCEAFLYLFVRHMFLVGIILGVLFSVLAAGVIIFGFCKSISMSFIVFALLSGSYCFMCYTTGGLENSLLYFLGAWFLYVYFKKPFLNQKRLFCLAFILSLLAWGRMDSVLPFVFIICYGYLFKTDVKFWKRVVIGICGLLPFIRHTILKL